MELGHARIAGALLLATVVGAATLAATPVGAAPVYPVNYSIASSSGVLAHPTAPPPGANIWTCRPSAAHPYPVVLVHGLGATMGENWGTMSPLLADNGYCVYALTYGLDPGEVYVGGLEPMEQTSAELADFVDRVLSSTGASQVDLVGHSEGTVMPQYYLKFRGGAAKVHAYVALTPLYQGTTLYGLAAGIQAAERDYPLLAGPISNAVNAGCGSCQEFLTGSPFLANLYADGVYAVPGVQYTTIMTRYDELVKPYTSGMLNAPNATNIVLQDQCKLDFSDHVAVAFDPTAGADILNALDPQHPRPVPCRLVLPGIGSP
jgi:pimeloyl-ACP methyl ester carboxylesterase